MSSCLKRKHLGQFLKQRRIARQLSPVRLAREMGMTYAQYNSIEKGEMVNCIPFIKKLFKFYGIKYQTPIK